MLQNRSIWNLASYPVWQTKLDRHPQADEYTHWSATGQPNRWVHPLVSQTDEYTHWSATGQPNRWVHPLVSQTDEYTHWSAKQMSTPTGHSQTIVIYLKKKMASNLPKDLQTIYFDMFNMHKIGTNAVYSRESEVLWLVYQITRTFLIHFIKLNTAKVQNFT